MRDRTGDDPRYDLELVGFPWSEPEPAAAAMAPAFGISVDVAMTYVQRAPMTVVRGATEWVIREYVRALHAAGASLKVLQRGGPAWRVAAAKPENPAFWAGEVPIDEGDTLPGWLQEVVPQDLGGAPWAGPADTLLGSELPDEAEVDVPDEDFEILATSPGRAAKARSTSTSTSGDTSQGLRKRPRRRRRSWPPPRSRADASTPAPSSDHGYGANSTGPFTRVSQREAVRVSAPYNAVPDVGQEINPFLERVSTGEIFRHGLALLRAERERTEDPLDKYISQNRRPGDSSIGKKKRKK